MAGGSPTIGAEFGARRNPAPDDGRCSGRRRVYAAGSTYSRLADRTVTSARYLEYDVQLVCTGSHAGYRTLHTQAPPLSSRREFEAHFLEAARHRGWTPGDRGQDAREKRFGGRKYWFNFERLRGDSDPASTTLYWSVDREDC